MSDHSSSMNHFNDSANDGGGPNNAAAGGDRKRDHARGEGRNGGQENVSQNTGQWIGRRTTTTKGPKGHL